MIDEPTPWKDELLAIAGRLEAKTQQKRWTGRTALLLERDFVAAAYAMRKLVDSPSIPTELRQRQTPVRRYDRSGKKPDPRCPDDIADSYDFDNGRRSTLSIDALCREIMDSCVFAFCCGETAELFDGIYVSSDREAYEYIYLILASDFIALCCDVGTEAV